MVPIQVDRYVSPGVNWKKEVIYFLTLYATSVKLDQVDVGLSEIAINLQPFSVSNPEQTEKLTQKSDRN